MHLEIAEALNALPRILALVAKGESVVLCDKTHPVAEIRPFPADRKAPRPIGLAKDKFTVPPAFFDPLPDALVETFEGNEE